MLWIIEGGLISCLIAYISVYGKGNNKIKVMSVKQELRKIKRSEDSYKKSIW